MINYGKTKLASGSIYEIIPEGLRKSTDRNKLTITTLLGGKTLLEVDSETEVTENIAIVTILDASGEEMDIRKGYKCQTGCKKQKDYVVGREVVGKGGPGENAVAEYKDVTATVVIIELTTGGVRAELDEARAQISELNVTVDALPATDLEE